LYELDKNEIAALQLTTVLALQGQGQKIWSQYNNRFFAVCPGLPGWAGTRRNLVL